jgi:hypothetical protein
VRHADRSCRTPISIRPFGAEGKAFAAGCAWIEGESVPVGDGAPGPVTMNLRRRYWGLHRDSRYALPVDYS